jgi:His-Xaa-Ser system radical SAM maturase HxsB
MSPSPFRPLSAFETGNAEYRLLPFRFMRWQDNSVLLTNECGEHEFVSAETFAALTDHRLVSTHTSYANLKAKHFLNDTESTLPIELLATKVRTKRSFLDGFTRLHIFVATLRCDHTCPYCQVSRVTEDRVRFDMSLETASRATDWVFRAPAKELKIEFQGGEPTLNWPVIGHVVGAASARAEAEGRTVDFVIATNLSSIDDEMLRFCKEHRIHLSTSLDGPADLHNANRPRPGRDSYERLRMNLHRARAVLGHDQVSALMTTTPASLVRPKEIIDEYVELGFDSVVLRPISPYGFATRTRLDRAYRAERFLAFYKQGLEHIIELNRRDLPIVEVYAQILLRKMLTPFPVGYVDLQSPAGAAIGVLVYNYDGDIYASDESRMLAEMGDHSFRLGNLATDTYREVMSGPRVRALAENSCLETLPGCSECAFAPYCGADPMFNWTTQSDIVGYRPTSEFCRRQMGIFEYLFDQLRKGDSFVRRLFLAWASQ